MAAFCYRLLEGEPMTDRCREFGISRRTGYKIFNRHQEHGCGASRPGPGVRRAMPTTCADCPHQRTSAPADAGPRISLLRPNDPAGMCENLKAIPSNNRGERNPAFLGGANGESCGRGNGGDYGRT
jgi:hypothetical protein